MEHVASDLLPVLQGMVVLAFGALTFVGLVRRRDAGAASRWLPAAFSTLTAGLALLFIPDWTGTESPRWVEAVGLLAIIAFPYLLLRFTATFRELPRPLEVIAAVAALIVGFLVVEPIDVDAAITEVALSVAILAYWAGVSLITVIRLWRAGHGQPGVARRRLRLMATAAAVLIAAVITAVQLGDASPATELAAYLFAWVSAIAFGLGFHPPRALRLLWRQEEQQQLAWATSELLAAESSYEITRSLLRPTVRIIGASGAAIVGSDGRVVAHHGDVPDPVAPADQAPGSATGSRPEIIPLIGGNGDLYVWTSTYTPFFGPEELGLLRSMATVAGLAIQRAELLSEERSRRADLEAARAEAVRAHQEAEAAREEAEQANLAKSDFLSRMSHELRTPLNAILGFAQLLETASLDPEDREGVDHILKAGRHLLALINDVLDLSRIEAGALTISLEPVRVGELVDDAVALIRPVAASRSIAVRIGGEGYDEYVMTDRQRCRQALLNLLSNAVKYNRDAGEVEVTCQRIEGDILRIAVRDTGSGIEPVSQWHLFEPFERLGAERSSIEGTGLGLALTKQLIERLGGSIGLHSVPGEGATFWIDVPLTAAPVELEEPAPSTPDDRSTARTVLVIEDNLANLRVVEAMLRRRAGTAVIPAMQGTIALELAYEHLPDIVVLDLHLPDIPGREVLKRLQADPRTRQIPVIIASADATPGRIRQLREDGAFRYVTKPLDLQTFLEAIDDALEGAAHAEPTPPPPAPGGSLPDR